MLASRRSPASVLALEAGLIAILLGFGLDPSAEAQHWPGIEAVNPPGAPNPALNSTFGVDVAVSGEWAAIGDYGGSPAIHMYRRTSAGWSHSQSIRGVIGTQYGASIDIDGDTMVAGVPNWGWPNTTRGRLWVYELIQEQWVRTSTLRAPELDLRSRMGASVAIEGDVIAAGAPSHHVGSPPATSGAIVVFERGASGWNRTAVLPWTQCCPNVPYPETGTMGLSIAISGNRILAGAPGSAEGEAYLFEKSPSGQWGRAAILLDPNPKLNGRFGEDVAIEGDTIVIGRPRFSGDHPFVHEPGSVYVFEHDTASDAWIVTQELQASDGHGGPTHGDRFGEHLALRGDRIAVAAHQHDGVEEWDGKVYVFERNNQSQWIETRQFESPEPTLENGYGWSVDINDQYVIIGVIDGHLLDDKRAYACELSIGASYCDQGSPIELSLIGTESVSDESLALVARQVPIGSASLNLFGTERARLPISGGQLCVGPTARRIGAVQQAPASGKLVCPLDFEVPPLAGNVFAGATLTFQNWTWTPGVGAELSNAVGVRLVQ